MALAACRRGGRTPRNSRRNTHSARDALFVKILVERIAVIPVLSTDANGHTDPVLRPRLKMADLKVRALIIHAGGDITRTNGLHCVVAGCVGRVMSFRYPDYLHALNVRG
jgi:hypothetical protein